MIPQAERRRHHQKARRSSPARGAGSCQAFAIEGGSDGAEPSGRSGWLCVRSAGRSVQGQARGYAAQSFMVHLHKLRKPPIVRLLTQPMSKLARLLSAAQNLPSAGDAPTAPTFLRRSRSPSMERRQCARRNRQPCAAPRNVGGSCRAGSGGVAAGVRRGPALVVVTLRASTASARGLWGQAALAEFCAG